MGFKIINSPYISPLKVIVSPRISCYKYNIPDGGNSQMFAVSFTDTGTPLEKYKKDEENEGTRA